MSTNYKSVGKLISTIDRYSEMYINKHLQHLGIGATQMHFLMLLYQKDGVTQYELAQKLYVDKATATRAIQKLEQLGYVIRKPSRDDQRKNLVYVTPQALTIRLEIISILGEWTSILTNQMSEEEKDSLIRLLNLSSQNAIRFHDEQ